MEFHRGSLIDHVHLYHGPTEAAPPSVVVRPRQQP
jgi:hypothetical protein